MTDSDMSNSRTLQRLAESVPDLAAHRPAVMVFHDDLRLHDNAALAAAAEHGPVVAVYVREDPEATEVRPLGRATQWWLHHSLERLAASLADYDVPLIVLDGDPLQLIPAVARQVGAPYVSWSRRYQQPQRDIDASLKTLLRAQGVQAHSFAGHLLAEPWEVVNSQDRPYQVYTPFSRRLRTTVEASFVQGVVPPSGAPRGLRGLGAEPEATRADLIDLALLPSHPARREPDWTAKLAEVWEPGEDGGRRRLADFLERINGMDGHPGYAAGRDVPSVPATSSLSPHLRFGEVSPHAVWAAVEELDDAGEDGTAFQNELMWRDFAWHRLYHHPDLATANMRKQFDDFPWSWDPEELSLGMADGRDGRRAVHAEGFLSDLGEWRSGTTGIPLVDAGMRELWHTGHMHNRVRMVVASFLCKNLAIHWRHGEEWFWDTLVDADPASNAFNWQWVAGSGDDASPYFRIFNPETQAKRFDGEGDYIARWVLEYGTDSYPEPIVDLKESREMALAAYEGTKR